MTSKRIAFCLSAGLAACVPDAADDPVLAPVVQAGTPAYSLIVSPLADGMWRADYTFTDDAPEWVFVRSRGDYRTASWEALDGSTLARMDGLDRLAPDGISARFRFRPEQGPLSRTYDPALVFTDGSVALFLDQFSLVAPDAIADSDLQDSGPDSGLDLGPGSDPNPGDIDGVRECFTLTLSTPARIVTTDGIADGPQSYAMHCDPDPASDEDPGYAYIGDIPLLRGESVTAVLDPGLPEWLTENLKPGLLATFDDLSDRFGGPLADPATLFTSFKGYDLEGMSQSGSVLDTAMVFSFKGDVFRKPSARLQSYLDNFLAHEATHLFQGRNGSYPYKDPWLSEGFASAMAHRIVSERNGPGAEWNAERTQTDDVICADAAATRTLRAALAAHPYECGQRIWRAVATPGTLPGLWDALMTEADGEPIDEGHLLDVLPAAATLRTALDLQGEAAFAALRPTNEL